MSNSNVIPFSKNGATSTTTGGHMFSDSLPDNGVDINQKYTEGSISFDDESHEKMEYNNTMTNNIQINDLVNDVKDLKAQNEVLKEQNVTTRWVIGILVTIFGIVTPLLFNAFSSNVNAKFDSINTEIKAINQRLDYQEKLNSIQIQRDVAIEIKNQKSVK